MDALKNSRGFTLVELLVAAAIFSFVIGLAAYSFRFYTNIVKKVVMPYPEEAVNFSKLQDTLRSIFYFVGEKKDLFGKRQFFLYFYGKPNEIKFISAKPIFGDSISVCRLYQKDGKLRLDESPVYSKYDNYKLPEIAADKKDTVLMNNVSKIEITYFTDKMETTFLKEKIPQLIKIDITQNNKKLTFYFKIESDFSSKKAYTGFIYEPF